MGGGDYVAVGNGGDSAKLSKWKRIYQISLMLENVQRVGNLSPNQSSGFSKSHSFFVLSNEH